jgi:curved DNA-binding protein CbpA
MATDYYAVLGVAMETDLKEIKLRYRQLVRENHPDVAPDKEIAHARMQIILEAWNVLSDAKERERYDRSLKGGEAYQSRLSDAPAQAQPPSEAVRRARAAQNFKNAQGTSRTTNARSRLLTMVFEAQMQFFQGNVEDAIEMANNVVKMDPTNAEAAALLGDIHLKQGKEDMALLWFERAMRYQPGNSLYKQKWESLRQKVAAAPPPPAPMSQTPHRSHPLGKKAAPPVAPEADKTPIYNLRDNVRAARDAARATEEAAAEEAQEEGKGLMGKLGSWFKGGAKSGK